MTTPLTLSEIRSLELLSIVIPEYSKDSSPFSSGQKIDKYKPDDLKKIPSAEKTDRTDWFEKRLLGIRLKIGRPVPYAFRTNNGEARSLDAGCLAYLLKRSPPELKATLDDEGYIVAVEPTGDLRQRYMAMEARLVKDIQPPTGEISTNSDPGMEGQEPFPATEPSSPADTEFEPLQIDFDLDAPVDERRREQSERAIREGAKQFRMDLLKAWRNKCAITGTPVIGALDGAHIYPYFGKKTNLVVNGVLLRADLHRLFDRHLVSFRYDKGNLLIVVSKYLAATEYAAYSGRSIELPIERCDQPDERFVRSHYQDFEKRRKKETADQ